MSLTLFLPASMKQLGNVIMKALDPDVGGDKTFGEASHIKEGVEYVSTSIPDVMPLSLNAAWWLFDVEQLFLYLEKQYVERWAEDTCPLLEDCQAFSDAVVAVNDEVVDTVAERFGYERITSSI